jgi:ribosomal protein S18 acetylase RimI-like enzyme
VIKLTELALRNANIDDRAMLDELFREELGFHKSLMPDIFRIPEMLIDEKWLRTNLSNDNEFLVVGESDGKIIGAVLYKIMTNPDDEIFQERTFGYIQEMIVSESQRGKGIGKKLLNFAISDLKSKNISDIELNIWEDNEVGLEFYKKQGFKTIRRRMKAKI